MSWPLLLPFAGRARGSAGGADDVRALAIDAAAFAAGALDPPARCWLPTLVRFGLHAGSGRRAPQSPSALVNPWIIFTTLARVFCRVASLEISRFIATDGAKRLEFFRGGIPGSCRLAIAVGIIGVRATDLDADRPPAGPVAPVGRRRCRGPKWAALAAPRGPAACLLVYASLLGRDGAAAGATRFLRAGADRVSVRGVSGGPFVDSPARAAGGRRRAWRSASRFQCRGWRGRRRRRCRSTGIAGVVATARAA